MQALISSWADYLAVLLRNRSPPENRGWYSLCWEVRSESLSPLPSRAAAHAWVQKWDLSAQQQGRVWNPLEGKVHFGDLSVEHSRVTLLTSKVRAGTAHLSKWPGRGAARRPCSVPGCRSWPGLCPGSEGDPGKSFSKLLLGLGVTQRLALTHGLKLVSCGPFQTYEAGKIMCLLLPCAWLHYKKSSKMKTKCSSKD